MAHVERERQYQVRKGQWTVSNLVVDLGGASLSVCLTLSSSTSSNVGSTIVAVNIHLLYHWGS